MLRVTDEARDKIYGFVEDAGDPARLERGDDGSFRLRPSAWRSGDMSYAHEGSAILLVEGPLAWNLADRTLDVQSDDEFQVRPRERPGSKSSRSPARQAVDAEHLVSA